MSIVSDEMREVVEEIQRKAPAAGLLLGRPRRGYVTQKPTVEMCFHYGPIIRFRHCGIFVRRCRDIICKTVPRH